MNVRTSQDLEAISCCPCNPPACNEPRTICESAGFTSLCADDDYTDAMRIWEAKVAAYEDWEVAHAAFPALHATWVTDHATWVTDHAAWEACEIATPGECGAEPVEPVEPVDPEEPEEPGAEPEIPDGYNDVTHGCYAPFAEPSGDPGDEIPTLYRTIRDNGSTTYSGEGWAYYSGAGTFPLSAEYLTIGTFTDWPGVGDAGASFDYTGNVHDQTADNCTPDTETGAPNFEFPNHDEGYTMGDTDPICLANQRGTETIGTWTSSPTPMELEGCPEIGVDFDEVSEAGWDYTLKIVTGDLLESGISKLDLIARAGANIPAGWEDPGSECIASAVADWPVASDLHIGADPEADPPVSGAWPECDSVEDLPHGYAAEATATKVRYKKGIPEEWADFDGRHADWVTDHADWVIAHAAWEAEDPETRGAEPVEPIEPTERTFFQWQADEGLFPKEWDEWKALKDAFDAATAAHEEWESCEEDCGDEPEIPADPGDEPTRPTKITSRSWTYPGGGGDAEFSDWFEMDAPSIEGEVRVVNELTKCHQNSTLGVAPTSHGEVFEFDE